MESLYTVFFFTPLLQNGSVLFDIMIEFFGAYRSRVKVDPLINKVPIFFPVS